MKIFFGADWHLYHKKILQFTDRPFDNIDIMKDVFIHEWKSKVANGDMVYLLGDISFSDRAIDDLKDLPGYKILIRGNHDSDRFSSSKIGLWDYVYDLKKINVGNHKLILCHYPIESWLAMQHGSIHLHGHTHNNSSHEIKWKKNRIDVGYDHTKQALSTLDELLELQNREEAEDRYNKIYHLIEGSY